MNKQRAILFVADSMNIGGVEKALLGVLRQYTDWGWEVHLALLHLQGGFLEYIPNGVTLHTIAEFTDIEPILHHPPRKIILHKLKKGHFFHSVKLAYLYFRDRILKNSCSLYQYAFRDIPMLCTKEFDIAVAFAGPYAFIDYYLSHRVKAKEKWGWIHFDISKFYYNKSISQAVYPNFTKLNVVSRQGCEIVKRHFPSLASRVHFAPNIIDTSLIAKMSMEQQPLAQKDTRLTLLTVGRISAEKGQHMGLQALKTLIDKGYKNILWWFIGTGKDETMCIEYVNANGLDQYVKFFGSQVNPYPWMQACDIYIQPSEYEGFCITLGEAILFNKPIVATNFTGAAEQLTSYSQTYNICSYDVASITNALEHIIMEVYRGKENNGA